jgi:hypothetical protein
MVQNIAANIFSNSNILVFCFYNRHEPKSSKQ